MCASSALAVSTSTHSSVHPHASRVAARTRRQHDHAPDVRAEHTDEGAERIRDDVAETGVAARNPDLEQLHGDGGHQPNRECAPTRYSSESQPHSERNEKNDVQNRIEHRTCLRTANRDSAALSLPAYCGVSVSDRDEQQARNPERSSKHSLWYQRNSPWRTVEYSCEGKIARSSLRERDVTTSNALRAGIRRWHPNCKTLTHTCRHSTLRAAWRSV